MTNLNNYYNDTEVLPVDPNFDNATFSSPHHVNDYPAPQSSTPQPAAGEALDPAEYMYLINDDGTFVCQFIHPYSGIPCQHTDTFPRPCDFRKHYKNHTKPVLCDYCDGIFPETKDRDRHMWTNHEDEARVAGTPGGDRIPCGFPGCDYKSRRNDNLKRHRERHSR